MIAEISLERLELFSKRLSQRQKRDPLFCRLYANAACFSPHALCSLFEVTNKGKTAGFICVYAQSATAYFLKKPNFDELADFFAFNSSGAKFLEIDTSFAQKIKRRLSAKAVFGSAYILKGDAKCIIRDCSVKKTENVKEFFEVLRRSCEAYSDTSFESYYCDYFYRKNLPAELFMGEYEGKAVSVAAVLHLFEKLAIISDVAVLPDFRRRKFGSQLVSEVCRHLKDKGFTPALFCTSPAAEALYKKLGFKKSRGFGLLMIRDDF